LLELFGDGRTIAPRYRQGKTFCAIWSVDHLISWSFSMVFSSAQKKFDLHQSDGRKLRPLSMGPSVHKPISLLALQLSASVCAQFFSHSDKTLDKRSRNERLLNLAKICMFALPSSIRAMKKLSRGPNKDHKIASPPADSRLAI